jgi:multidrug efflux pump subunit AcrA (membrane-fusion protein)
VVISAGMPVVRLVNTDSLQVWLGVPAELAASLEDDESHAIEIRGQDYDATLAAVLPEIDQTTRARTVIFQLDAESSNDISPGEVARVKLGRRITGSGYWLPLTAMMREARGLWSVFVAEPEGDRWVLSRRFVEIVHLRDDRALVRGTLDSGDLVVADGTHRVVAGQRVRCNDASTTTDPSGSQLP